MTGRATLSFRCAGVHWLLVLAAIVCIIGQAMGGPVPLPAIREAQIANESYSLVPYRDGAAWSVGIGHNLSAHRETMKARYTPAEVERFFLRDVAWSLAACRAGIRGFDELPHDVQLVAVGIAFTIGRTGLARWSSLRSALSRRDYASARTAIRRSRWATQVGATRLRATLDILSHHVR